MKTTRRTTTYAVVMLVGTLGLGACAETHTVDDAAAQVEVADAKAAAAKAAAARAAAEAQQLRKVRQTSPTAGMEVPPDSLTTHTVPDTVRDDNLRAGTPRVDGADIGWPDRVEER
ncbi:hypothetical protein [Ornithinimicrobium sediminis]|uniref:hypothetical protein n=1 Tax=Ornithinimicrobium sediminis TaxID=2904603 RepID=UPI001E4D93CA|nr:hypothetical protein [Ornithinimicrobium sediminis]MCE0486023.1 hypothetical protein [Ornithinimicrobium sediminis]